MPSDCKKGEQRRYHLPFPSGKYAGRIYKDCIYYDRICREIDLTVIQIVDGADNVFVDTSGYSVIAVDAGNYKERVHNIAI